MSVLHRSPGGPIDAIFPGQVSRFYSALIKNLADGILFCGLCAMTQTRRVKGAHKLPDCPPRRGVAI